MADREFMYKQISMAFCLLNTLDATAAPPTCTERLSRISSKYLDHESQAPKEWGTVLYLESTLSEIKASRNNQEKAANANLNLGGGLSNDGQSGAEADAAAAYDSAARAFSMDFCGSLKETRKNAEADLKEASDAECLREEDHYPEQVAQSLGKFDEDEKNICLQ